MPITSVFPTFYGFVGIGFFINPPQRAVYSYILNKNLISANADMLMKFDTLDCVNPQLRINWQLVSQFYQTGSNCDIQAKLIFDSEVLFDYHNHSNGPGGAVVPGTGLDLILQYITPGEHTLHMTFSGSAFFSDSDNGYCENQFQIELECGGAPPGCDCCCCSEG